MSRYRNSATEPATALCTPMSRGSWTKRFLAAVLFVVVLAPINALAGLIEYALILGLIVLAFFQESSVPLPPGSTVVLQQLVML